MKILSLICLLFITVSAHAGVKFMKSYEDALAKGQEEGKPIFIDVTASWCGPCKMLEKKVFHNSKFADLHNEKYINVQLDEKYHRNLLAQLRVKGYPTLIYMDYEGNELFRTSGFDPDFDYIDLSMSFLGENNVHKDNINRLAKVKDPVRILEWLTDGVEVLKLDGFTSFVNSAVVQVPTARETILRNFGELLYERTIRALYADNEKEEYFIRDSFIHERLALALYLKELPHSLANISKVAATFKDIGIPNIENIKTYLYAYHTFFLQPFDNSRGIEIQKNNAAKKLLKDYWHCADKELYYNVLAYIIRNEESQSYFQQLAQSIEGQLESSEDFSLYDLYSVALLKTGQIEEASAAVAKAHTLALKQGIKYDPSIQVMREYF